MCHVCWVYVGVTGASEYTREIIRFTTSNSVTDICVYNDIIFLVNDRLSSCDHMKVEIYLHPFDVMVMTQDDGDKLIFTSFDPRCLYYTPIQSVGDTCTLGNTHSKQPNYRPYGLSVNHKKNLVAADQSNKSLHV